MRKLTLSLESLAVQSFETTRDGAAARGTVLARAEATPYCDSPVCKVTDQQSCNGTCDYSACDASCYGSCPSCCIASCMGSCQASCGDTCPQCVDPTTSDPVFD